MDENCDYTLKLLIAGDSSVGKTNFIMRFVNNEFNISYMTTSGIDLKTKDIEIKNKKIRVQIWDTAGQVKYRAITRNLFLKVMGAILIYDITNEKSYNNLKEWMKLIREECGKHMQIIMVGNKCDLDSERKINQDEVYYSKLNLIIERLYNVRKTAINSFMEYKTNEKIGKTISKEIEKNSEMKRQVMKVKLALFFALFVLLNNKFNNNNNLNLIYC